MREKGERRMEVTQYKCTRCGRHIEVFKELGKYAAACSNGSCRLAYEYPMFETEKERDMYLEKSFKK